MKNFAVLALAEGLELKGPAFGTDDPETGQTVHAALIADAQLGGLVAGITEVLVDLGQHIRVGNIEAEQTALVFGPVIALTLDGVHAADEGSVGHLPDGAPVGLGNDLQTQQVSEKFTGILIILEIDKLDGGRHFVHDTPLLSVSFCFRLETEKFVYSL